MAKTFKNLPRPVEPTASKPLSERDFFDLTDEPVPAKKAVGKAETAHNTRNTSNSGNIGNTSNSSNITASDSPLPEASPGVIATMGSEGVRQTFVLNRGHLEQLRDYVHNRRAQGDYTYSQKQALQDALDLLFAAGAPVAPRPDQTREQEQQRRQRIQRGRQAKSGE